MAINKYLTLDDTGNKELEVEAPTTSPGAGSPVIPAIDPATGQFDPSFIPGAEAIVVEASESLSANDLVNIWDDGGTFKARKADGTSYATRATGFVLNAYNIGESATVFAEGIVSGQTGLDPSLDVYLSTTAGETTQDPSTTSGHIWQNVGMVISATQFIFERGSAKVRA